MEQTQTYIFMFGILILVGQLTRKSTIPIALILVVVGVALSFFPFLPEIKLNPEIVLDGFLPLLIYQISSFSSWRDIKKNIRPITLLSIGHVVFITILVAVVMHAVIPQLGWPLAFILGAVISPPDDVAIVSIAQNVRIPERVYTILEGEAMFNDAAALTLFRFALAALVTHQFSPVHLVSTFFAVIIGETLYGLALGNIIGKLREKISNPTLHLIASILTPFLAYLPVVKLGGSGVVATAITGFIIGNQYSLRYSPDFRLISRAVWPSVAFTIQGILFLMLGFNMRELFQNISAMPFNKLLIDASIVIGVVIIGRFIWEFVGVAFLPRVFFPSIRKKSPYPSWKYLFIISWAGMRGGISLAAALSVPFLPLMSDGTNPRDLLLFLVCCVIIATLMIQGLTLPWLIKVLGVNEVGEREKYNEHIAELLTRLKMARSALRWLLDYRKEISDNVELKDEVTVHIRQYRMQIKQLKNNIANHDTHDADHDEEAEINSEACLVSQIIDIERTELLKLWRMEKINLLTRNKLMSRLDHRIQHLSG